MALSKDIDSFIHWLNDRGETFSLSLLKNLVSRHAEPARGVEDRNQQMFERHLATAIVASAKKAVFHAGAYKEFVGSDPDAANPEAIDDWLTRVSLAHIPEWVRRYGRLRELLGEKPPPPAVAQALEQASECYLRGLDAASAVLCRTVLELALEDRVGGSFAALLKQHGNDYLNKLVQWANSTRRLSPSLTAMEIGRASCRERV